MHQIRKYIQSHVDRLTKLSTGPGRSADNDLHRDGCVSGCRQISSVVDGVWVLGISEYGSEFVSDPNSEFLASFSS